MTRRMAKINFRFFVAAIAWLGLLGTSPLLAAPEVMSISPPDGAVLDTTEVTLEGRIEGAVRLTVDGTEVPLEHGSFRAGPFELSEGSKVFLLVFEVEGGEERQVLHRVERDGRA